MIHPGRKFLKDLGPLANPKLAGDILKEVEAYLAMSQEEKARIPVKDTGDSEGV